MPNVHPVITGLASSLVLATLAACHVSVNVGNTTGDVPGMSAITESDLRRDLFAMASDSMRGREAGTPDELRAAAWVAERAREAGLRPAGDDGTYFQWWPMRRVRPSDESRVLLDGAPLVLWRDVSITAAVDTTLDLSLVWVGTAGADSLRRLDLRGKAVAAMIVPPARPPVSWISLRPWRYGGLAIRERAAALTAAGAAAVLLVADDSANDVFPTLAVQNRRGTFNVDTTGAARVPARAPVLWAPNAMRDRVARAGRLALTLRAESFVYPSANVVAVAPGRDNRLGGEYVLFSGHHDHDGVRNTIAGDSIWNGADDNATVSVAMLAIGRAFVKAPGRRAALFVWHGAEERGLLGSRWYAAHPTVPRERIVAVLNGDMIGRNNPDSAALLGSQPPHRNSSDLVAMALRANALTGRFVLDTIWDRPTHSEGWYFRSDHLPYARLNVPALMYSTNLHDDYHTPRDDPGRIDYPKLTRMAQWMYLTGWFAANAPARPALDPGFRLER